MMFFLITKKEFQESLVNLFEDISEYLVLSFFDNEYIIYLIQEDEENIAEQIIKHDIEARFLWPLVSEKLLLELYDDIEPNSLKDVEVYEREQGSLFEELVAPAYDVYPQFSGDFYSLYDIFGVEAKDVLEARMYVDSANLELVDKDLLLDESNYKPSLSSLFSETVSRLTGKSIYDIDQQSFIPTRDFADEIVVDFLLLANYYYRPSEIETFVRKEFEDWL